MQKSGQAQAATGKVPVKQLLFPMDNQFEWFCFVLFFSADCRLINAMFLCYEPRHSAFADKTIFIVSPYQKVVRTTPKQERGFLLERKLELWKVNS